MTPPAPMKAISEVCEKPQYGWTTKSELDGIGLKLLRITDIQDGRVDWSGVPHCVKEPKDPDKYILNPGDIVVARSGATVGKSYLIRNPDPSVFASYLVRLRATGEISPNYLFWYLQTPAYWRQISEARSGIAQPNVNASKLGAVELPVPPIDEQRRIVEAIETHLSHLDAGVESLERAKRNVQRMRAALVKAAVVGSAAERVKEEDVEDLLGRIAAEIGRAPRFTDAPFAVPSHWSWVPFEDVTVNLDSRRIPLKASDRENRQGKYPYYGAQGIIDHIDDYLFDGPHLLIAEDGANLLSRNKPLAFIADGQFWVNNHAHVVRAAGGIPLVFLEAAVNASDLSGRITGTAQPKLTQKNLRSLPIPIPPLREQHRIVAEVERQTSLIDDLESTIRNSSTRSSALRRAVLASAFAGQL